MASRPLPEIAELRKLLTYDADIGVFIWLERPIESFPSARIWKAWNTRWANKPAGSNADGYIVVSPWRGRKIRAHRLAWAFVTGEWPDNEVDHIDNDRADNRWINLRAATRTQNKGNLLKYKNNQSGFKGVCFHTSTGRWTANIRIARRTKYLGLFDTPEAAHAAYCEAAKEEFGEFFNPGH